jgi:hypothetical protein
MPEFNTELLPRKDKAPVGIEEAKNQPRLPSHGSVRQEAVSEGADRIAHVRNELVREGTPEQNDLILKKIAQMKDSKLHRPGEGFIIHPELSPNEWFAKMEATAREAVPSKTGFLGKFLQGRRLNLSWPELLKAILKAFRSPGASEQEEEQETQKKAA